jgi:spore coat protein A
MASIGRRKLLRWGLVGGLGLAARRTLAQNPWAHTLDDYSRVRPPMWSSPLPIPPVLVPRREGAADVYEVTARRGEAQPLPGAPTKVWGFDGAWPGPTIAATRGRPVLLRVRNGLDEPISVHNHGHTVAAASDGHPVDYVRPGAEKTYEYPNQQSGGTYWYHDHAMGLTGPHVYRGLAGMYLIHDPSEDALGLPSGAYDVPLVLQDRLFDAQNALSYSADAGTIFKGFIGNTLCVNGVHSPRFEVAARKYRLRILNGSNARNFRLALSTGHPVAQVASDGSLLGAPVVREAVDLSPSERCDVVVDFARYSVGTSVVLRNLDPTWPELPDVLRFDVTRREDDPSRVPGKLATIERLDVSRPAARRTVRFQLDGGKWTMNGLHFDPGRIDFRPRLGTTEVWTLHNAEPTQMHPFHRHLVPFQVLDVDGAAPPPELGGWKDTVAVGPGSRVRIAMQFQRFAGVYVFHCHKLEHEDHAMMLQEEVG